MARRTALPLWLPRLSRMTTSPGFSVGARTYIGPEALAVDWTIETPWGLDTITPQGGAEGHCLPVTVRDLCREPAAPRAPTSDWSHVGLDPGFIDEDETGRINPRLIFFPARAAARHVGAILLGRQHAFFEAHSLAMDEIPDRAIADGNAAFGEVRHEPAHGHLGLGRDPLHEPAPFSIESAGPMAPHLPTRGAARPPKPLRPAHDTRHAHREDSGNGSHAVSRRDPVRNSLAKIQ